MLDPELLDELAAHPEKNAPEVNVALAEQGSASVLVALARSGATQGEALTVIVQRMAAEGAALEPPRDDDEDEGRRKPVLLELDELLVANPHTPRNVLDVVLDRHAEEPWFVLAGVVHPHTTERALECAARWPAMYPVLDRLWLGLVSSNALGPLTAEAWSQDDSSLLREAAGRICAAPGVLAVLADDPRREVRRAVASNPHAGDLRERLAAEDAAPEVRARAAHPVASHGTAAVGGARFAAALRAMEAGGVLAPDVTGALADAEGLDEEGASLAAQVLSASQVVALLRGGLLQPEVSVGLATGLALRRQDDKEQRRELVVDVCKALSQLSDRYGALTGKARFAAWLGDGLANSRTLERRTSVCDLNGNEIVGDASVLGRAVVAAPDMLGDLVSCASTADRVSPAMLEIAWRSESVSDEEVVELAGRLSRMQKRGRDLPEDDLDLDPSKRSLDVLERVVLAVDRRTTFSPRTALAVVSLDSRRVRYVLTALPQWRGHLTGTMLGRVLRQNAGALKAARREARSHAATVEPWTERVLSDTEVAVALAVGHYTAEALVARMRSGRHRVSDGISVASGAEARAALQGSASVKPLIRWAGQQRSSDGAALAMWLLLEAHDRPRLPSMIASAVDGLVRSNKGVSDSAAAALAMLERRQPGRLETVAPQTPKGRATLASAVARAYRAVGGLRDGKG